MEALRNQQEFGAGDVEFQLINPETAFYRRSSQVEPCALGGSDSRVTVFGKLDISVGFRKRNSSHAEAGFS